MRTQVTRRCFVYCSSSKILSHLIYLVSMRKPNIFWIFIFVAPLFIFISYCPLLAKTVVTKLPKTENEKVAAIEWRPYQIGMADARQMKKPIFIDFYTDWCHWCHELDRTTYQDSRVIQQINSKFVSIKIDAESKEGAPLAGRYPIRGYPSLWFLKSNGEVITPVNGYMTADQMLPLLAYIGDGYYASMTYDQFMQGVYSKAKR